MDFAVDPEIDYDLGEGLPPDAGVDAFELTLIDGAQEV